MEDGTGPERVLAALQSGMPESPVSAASSGAENTLFTVTKFVV
jgi:hypothetical protein